LEAVAISMVEQVIRQMTLESTWLDELGAVLAG